MIPAFVKELGNSNSKTASATIAHTFTGTVAAGNLIVARVLFDNAAVASKPIVSSIGKMAGETNNWVLLGAARSTSTTLGAFASGEMWCIQTTVAWSAAAYTVTLDLATSPMRAVHFQEFSGTLATVRSTAGTNYSTTTTAASAATTGTTPVINDLAIGFIFGSNVAAAMAGDNDTTGGSWSAVSGFGSTGSSGATNNFGIGQYKVLTAASAQTLNNSAAMTAGNGSIVAILQSIPEPAITQAAYQFFDETGTESGAASLAAQNTAVTGNLANGDGFGVVRVRLQSTTSQAVPSTDDYTLQWEKNASGTWTDAAANSIADTYSEANYGGSYNSYTNFYSSWGQTFLGNGGKLTQARFYAKKFGTPVGNIVAELYAHTGTYGVDGVPTGSPLATSTARAATSLTTTSGWEAFTFDGTVTMGAGTPYIIVLTALTVGDSANCISTAGDTTSPTHSGHAVAFEVGNTWTTNGADRIFEVSSTSPVVPYDNPNLTEGQATTNRLTGGTGSFVAGKVSEIGHVTNIGWAGNNFTELVFPVKLIAANFITGDVLRFRVVRNGSTATMTYSVTPTINITAPINERDRSFTIAATVTLPTETYTPGSSGGGPLFTDDFNRADGGLGANWTTAINSPIITSNRIQVASSAGAALLTTWTGGDDQWAEMDLITTGADGSCIAPCVRMTADISCYYAWIHQDDGNRVGIWKATSNSTFTNLAYGPAGGPSSGTLRCEVIGNTIRALLNGVEQCSVTDTTSPFTTGKPGFDGYSPGNLAVSDNFSAGSAGAPPAGTSYNETDRSVSVAATVTLPTETFTHAGNFTETGRSISITATAAVVDQVDYKSNTSLPITIVATVTLPGSLVVTDDFNRANGLLQNPPWVTIGGSYGVSGNKVEISILDYSSYVYYDAAFSNDQYAELDSSSPSVANDRSIGPATRMTGAEGGGYLAANCYYAWINALVPQVEIWRKIGGDYVMIGTPAALPNTTPKLRLESIGSVHKVYVNGSSTAAITVTNTEITTGKPGIVGHTPAFPIVGDNFAAGDAIPHVAYSETNRSITITATVTTVDQADWKSNTGLAVPVVATVVLVEQVDYKSNTGLTFPITATVATVDQADFKETATPLALPVVATVTAPTQTHTHLGNFNETGRSIDVVGTVTVPTEQVDYKSNTALSVTASVTTTLLVDQADFKDTPVVLPVTATTTLPTETFTHFGNYVETGRSILITATSAASDQADWKEPGLSLPVTASTTVPTDKRKGLETGLALPLLASTAVTHQADFKNLAIGLSIVADVTCNDNQQSPGHFEDTGLLLGIAATVTRTDQADFKDLARSVAVTATVVCTDTKRYVEARSVPVVAAVAVTGLAVFRDSLSLPLTATTTITDQADFKQLPLTVGIASTVTCTDVSGEAVELLSIVVGSTVTSTDRADFNQVVLALPVAASTSVVTQMSMVALLALTIGATLRATDRKGSTLITVLNDADVLYLGNELVSRVYVGATQVWPGP